MSLNRQDWLEEARNVLTQKGVNAVRIEVLAKNLSVSKGSFYWHFKNRQELLTELLNYWARVTDELIAHGQTIAKPKERLHNLFNSIASMGVSGEEVIQVWAKQDENVAKQVHEVEQKRLNYLTSIFLEQAISETEAKKRAEVCYLAFLGFAFKTSQDSTFTLEFSDLGSELVNLLFQED